MDHYYRSSRVSRWDTTVPCPRTAPDGEPCEGTVRVYGYYDAGICSGPPEHCSPPEGEDNADACEVCGHDDWTDAELRALTEAAGEGADDDGPEYEPDEDY